MSVRGPDTHARWLGPQFVCKCEECGRVWIHKRFTMLRPTSTCFGCGARVTPTKIDKKHHTSDRSQKEGERHQVLINTCREHSKAKMFAKEGITGRPVLFDSGAEVSIISAEACGSRRNLDSAEMYELRGVTGGCIKTLGKCRFPLDPGFSKTFVHELIVVDMQLPYIILGQDFMRANGILLDPKAEAAYLLSSSDAVDLSFFDDVLSVAEEVSPWQIATIVKSFHVDRVEVKKMDKCIAAKRGEELCLAHVSSFPELTATPNYKKIPKHNFSLDIVFSNDTPITQRPRKFSIEEHGNIKHHMLDLIQRGAAVRGSSTYVSPVVLVPKKNGGTRVCVDYTKVNSQTVPLNYPIPLIRDLVFRLQYNHSWFTVLDLREAYFSLPLTRRASRRAAIITYDGVFKPLCTQFGLRNAPARFCEMIASMIRGLESSVFYYLDDFIIFSKTIDEHVVHVRQLLERLDEYGMYIQIEKCHFCEPQVNFLGYQISENGFLPMVDNVQAIRAMTHPTNLQELRRFLGMMNYYHNFIPKIGLFFLNGLLEFIGLIKHLSKNAFKLPLSYKYI